MVRNQCQTSLILPFFIFSLGSGLCILSTLYVYITSKIQLTVASNRNWLLAWPKHRKHLGESASNALCLARKDQPRVRTLQGRLDPVLFKPMTKCSETKKTRNKYPTIRLSKLSKARPPQAYLSVHSYYTYLVKRSFECPILTTQEKESLRMI